MSRYSALLGKRVEVHYRAGEFYLSTTGALVADSGKSIAVEDRYSKRGPTKTMRLEIPYPCIVRCTALTAESPDGQESWEEQLENPSRSARKKS